MIEFSLAAAFLAGLLGGVHCIGMCGGIVGALGLGLPASVRQQRYGVLPYLLGYNAGRLISYTLAGALFGGVGVVAANLLAVNQAQQVLQFVAGIFMVALGLYLGGWWFGIARLERAGGGIWRRLEPLGRKLLPVRTLPQALALGLVWGWLPCGLVYSILIWAIAAGSAVEGALLLLAFGLGTLPNLLAMGLFAARLAAWTRQVWVRRIAGATIMAFGVATLAGPWIWG
ncbi:sulfite exporter TauE/SafE family protein [Thiohalomonas denitrificans]|uniref:sulfite exporter TauE/SafE family protein n=1 Tax=Thiohalomonas denitrificans TaxID=415747 RepID=UPI0026EAD74D|nr:sulfite exporter TauE/SafE family protein [Thiohalomonas denitrificans]